MVTDNFYILKVKPFVVKFRVGLSQYVIGSSQDENDITILYKRIPKGEHGHYIMEVIGKSWLPMNLDKFGLGKKGLTYRDSVTPKFFEGLAYYGFLKFWYDDEVETYINQTVHLRKLQCQIDEIYREILFVRELMESTPLLPHQYERIYDIETVVQTKKFRRMLDGFYNNGTPSVEYIREFDNVDD